MRPQSLTSRALVVALLAQVLGAAVLCTAAVLHEFHTRLRALDTQIQGSSDSLLGAVQDAEDPEANVQIDPAELRLPSRDVFAVYAQGGRLLGSSPGAPPELIARTEPGFREMDLSHEKYRILQRDALRVIDRAEYKGVGLRRPVTIVYAAPEKHLRHEVFEAARFDVLTSLLLTGAMAFALPALIRRTLRPVRDLAAATAEIRAPEFRFYAPASAVGVVELRPLTEVLSRSMARVRASFAREQHFVSDAAHELKTATAVVRSSAQVLLLKRRSEREYRAGLERVVDDIERLETLVGQMLQLARAEGTTAGEAPPLDLGESARRTVALLQPIAEQRNLRIHTDIADGLKVRLRADHAETLVGNLLLNALQHSPPFAPPVAVVLRRNDDGQIQLFVSDQGAGIRAEALPYIFERFYREDESRSRETGGTGLGLAIAKSIVETAHGTIAATSQKGAGTTMHVTFSAA